MTNQQSQTETPETTEKKQDPQHKPEQHMKDNKDQNQPDRSDDAKCVK